MRNAFKYSIFLFILFNLLCRAALAWDHSVDIGYGLSHDPNHSRYINSGILINGDFLPIYRTTYTYWTANAALGQWHTNSPTHKNLTTAALALALRYYLNPQHVYPAYLLASVGPAYLSSRQFGYNEQGSNVAFQVIGGVGMEFNNIDANFRLVHYSNANLASPNEGYNVLYMLSLGYLF